MGYVWEGKEYATIEEYKAARSATLNAIAETQNNTTADKWEVAGPTCGPDGCPQGDSVAGGGGCSSCGSSVGTLKGYLEPVPGMPGNYYVIGEIAKGAGGNISFIYEGRKFIFSGTKWTTSTEPCLYAYRKPETTTKDSMNNAFTDKLKKLVAKGSLYEYMITHPQEAAGWGSNPPTVYFPDGSVKVGYIQKTLTGQYIETDWLYYYTGTHFDTKKLDDAAARFQKGEYYDVGADGTIFKGTGTRNNQEVVNAYNSWSREVPQAATGSQQAQTVKDAAAVAQAVGTVKLGGHEIPAMVWVAAGAAALLAWRGLK